LPWRSVASGAGAAGAAGAAAAPAMISSNDGCAEICGLGAGLGGRGAGGADLGAGASTWAMISSKLGWPALAGAARRGSPLWPSVGAACSWLDRSFDSLVSFMWGRFALPVAALT